MSATWKGFAAAARAADLLGSGGRRLALQQIALIVAAKGGVIADITVGDCLELMELRDMLPTASVSHGVAGEPAAGCGRHICNCECCNSI